MSNQFMKATAVASAVSGVLFAANASAIDTKASTRRIVIA